MTPATLIDVLCYALLAAILIRIVFSYVEGPFPRNSLHRIAFDITEPLLRPIRNVLPPTAGFDLFGPEQKVTVHADSGIKVGAHVPDLGVAGHVVRRRATIFFVWMAGFIALVALIGFIPAIAVFVCAYMRFGFGEPWRNALGFAAGTTFLCYVVFHWALAVAWPPSLLGELFPDLRAATRLF